MRKATSAAKPDHHVSRALLMAAVPRHMRRIVKTLPDCPCCGDINIDQSAVALLTIVCTAVRTQDETWANGAIESCKKFLDWRPPTDAESAKAN